jgi:hypothetical protein
MAAPALDKYFASDASRIEGKIDKIMRVEGRISALLKKDVLPDGMGFNFSTVITKRSTGTGGGWVAVSTPDGSGNNCVPTPTIVAPARTQISYSAVQTVQFSEDICFRDLAAAYDAKDQLATDRDNFIANVVDLWDIQDKAQFTYWAGHKIVFNSSLTETTNGTTMPAVAATSTINQGLLDALYNRATQDGAGRESAYAKRQGAPILPLILSQEAHRTLIKGDDSIRNDFRWADSGKGDGAVLLQSWGIDREYGGYHHIIDQRMPRWDLVDGAWVSRPFYASAATTIGNAADVSAAYTAATYEDAYIFSPDVMTRQVPKPATSFGSGSSAKAISFNGEVVWLNIPNKDTNPFSDTGFFAARLYAAYKPRKVQYGYVVRFLRCPNVSGTVCPAY